MGDMAKSLILIGVICIALGVVVWFAGKIPGVGKLPGDIIIKREDFTFYFPLATSILLSLFITFILALFNRR